MKKKIVIFINKFADIILGKHPHNTIFSYNYHNIRHIINFQKKFSSKLETSEGTLADIGAGKSPYYFIYKNKIEKYIAIDVEGSLPVNEMRPVEQRTGFAEKLPVEDASVDIALSNQVLEHVLDAEKSVQEAYRILKPGGYFIGSVPHISPIHLEPYDFRRFTALGLNKLFQENGFTHVFIEGNGGVHKAAALLVMMDWFLSEFSESKTQKFSIIKALILFPLVGFINVFAIIMDFIAGDKKRSPSNYCWVARKM